ncbi:MAG: 4Fe-4S binding protein, partial [Duncaniella sp.]|nr:4Fe-4S binding protein [Duncaniella sp.]
PYKKTMSVGLIPMVDRNLCNSCGRCAADCPADAISTADPTLTIKDRCISCGRCITHCPRNARKHGGLKYKLIDFIFTRAFSKKREAEYTVL